jgi:hypothetical protein
MSKKSLWAYSSNQYLLRYGLSWCDIYSRCSMWFPCISTQLSALRRTEVRVLSKIPGFARNSDGHSLLSAVITCHCSALNTLEHLYICLHSQNSIKIGPVDWASASWPLFTESLVQVLSDNAETMRWCPILHEPYVFLFMKRHLFQEYW